MNAEQPRCLGCKVFVRPTKKAPVPICKRCRADRRTKERLMDKWALIRWYRNADAEAERETANLPREDAFIPLTGEALVLKMQRGEW